MATGKSGGAASATPASVAVKVVIQTSAGTDGQLLYEAVSLTSNKSGLISQLAMRGWLNLLHGTPAVERSIQLRMIGFPDEVIEQIDAAIPNPQFLGLDQREASDATPTAFTRNEVARASARQSERKKSAPAAMPAPAPAAAEVDVATAKASDQTPAPTTDTPAPPPSPTPAEHTQIFQPPAKSRLGDPFAGGGLA